MRSSLTGDSRIEGLTSATPACFSIIRAISVARRLSKAATLRPPKLGFLDGVGTKWVSVGESKVSGNQVFLLGLRARKESSVSLLTNSYEDEFITFANRKKNVSLAILMYAYLPSSASVL